MTRPDTHPPPIPDALTHTKGAEDAQSLPQSIACGVLTLTVIDACRIHNPAYPQSNRVGVISTLTPMMLYVTVVSSRHKMKNSTISVYSVADSVPNT
jgi:hypothetical protein